MAITDLLERNSKLYGEEVALVEINPEIREEQRVTWREYELIQPTSTSFYRRQITTLKKPKKALSTLMKLTRFPRKVMALQLLGMFPVKAFNRPF